MYNNNTLQPTYVNNAPHTAPYYPQSMAAYQVPDENTAPKMLPTGYAYETSRQQKPPVGMAGMPVNHLK